MSYQGTQAGRWASWALLAAFLTSCVGDPCAPSRTDGIVTYSGGHALIRLVDGKDRTRFRARLGGLTQRELGTSYDTVPMIVSQDPRWSRQLSEFVGLECGGGEDTVMAGWVTPESGPPPEVAACDPDLHQLWVDARFDHGSGALTVLTVDWLSMNPTNDPAARHLLLEARAASPFVERGSTRNLDGLLETELDGSLPETCPEFSKLELEWAFDEAVRADFDAPGSLF